MHFTVIDNWENKNEHSLLVEIAFLKGFDIREWYSLLRQAKYSSKLVYNDFESLEVEDIFVPKLFEHIYTLTSNENSLTHILL